MGNSSNKQLDTLEKYRKAKSLVSNEELCSMFADVISMVSENYNIDVWKDIAENINVNLDDPKEGLLTYMYEEYLKEENSSESTSSSEEDTTSDSSSEEDTTSDSSSEDKTKDETSTSLKKNWSFKLIIKNK